MGEASALPRRLGDTHPRRRFDKRLDRGGISPDAGDRVPVVHGASTSIAGGGSEARSVGPFVDLPTPGFELAHAAAPRPEQRSVESRTQLAYGSRRSDHTDR